MYPENPKGNNAMNLIRIILLALSIGAILSGCAGSEKTSPKKDMKIPEWVLKPPKEKGYVMASGSYAVTENDRDPNFAKTMADNRARQEVAQFISARVVSAIKDFRQNLGLTQIETNAAAEAAAVTLSNLDVSAAEIVKREYLDGVMFSLARWPLDQAAREKVTRAAREGMYNNEALRSKFEAEKSWGKLEERLNKEVDNAAGGGQ